jgi:methyltransferase (TIGR00027 family)
MIVEGPIDLGPLSATARWTAAVRARETARADRLFSDPWAEALAGPVGAAWIAGRSPDSTAPIAIRTRYFDDWLARCTEALGPAQVVLVGAGLDTRAFRLDWPVGTRAYELDRADVLGDKERILSAAGAAPRCDRVVVAADLGRLWAGELLDAGFEVDRPSIWLLEGLLFYLPICIIGRLLAEVSRLAARQSAIGFDIVNGPVLTSPLTRDWIAMQTAAGAPWIGTMDDPVATLAGLGWTAGVTQPGAADASYGRWALPVISPTAPGMPHSWYVTGTRTRA